MLNRGLPEIERLNKGLLRSEVRVPCLQPCPIRSRIIEAALDGGSTPLPLVPTSDGSLGHPREPYDKASDGPYRVNRCQRCERLLPLNQISCPICASGLWSATPPPVWRDFGAQLPPQEDPDYELGRVPHRPTLSWDLVPRFLGHPAARRSALKVRTLAMAETTRIEPCKLNPFYYKTSSKVKS